MVFCIVLLRSFPRHAALPLRAESRLPPSLHRSTVRPSPSLPELIPTAEPGESRWRNTEVVDEPGMELTAGQKIAEREILLPGTRLRTLRPTNSR